MFLKNWTASGFFYFSSTKKTQTFKLFLYCGTGDDWTPKVLLLTSFCKFGWNSELCASIFNQTESFWIHQKTALFKSVSEEIRAFQLWISVVERFSGNEQRRIRAETFPNKRWIVLKFSETSTRGYISGNFIILSHPRLHPIHQLRLLHHYPNILTKHFQFNSFDSLGKLIFFVNSNSEVLSKQLGNFDTNFPHQIATISKQN